jgi:hypothetical protein
MKNYACGEWIRGGHWSYDLFRMEGRDIDSDETRLRVKWVMFYVKAIEGNE